ncbi:Hint domain-containing protein [Ancylobacter sonchi]|uniref:Hint domain-containing protein n=1 Tax=Ancylobacter sonchi TaxID=1937790 RepID=UPI001BD677CB|nr:Hint domain-containing protein [Ancylobacter sonchi]MBS7534846.1 Hint domain-containing protein [Ancylobacter sonchi]
MADLSVASGATTTVETNSTYGNIFLGTGSTLVADGASLSTNFLDAGTNSVIRITDGGTFTNTGWTNGSNVTFEVDGSSTLDFSAQVSGGGGISGQTIVFTGTGDGTVKLPGGVTDLKIEGFNAGDLLQFNDDNITDFRTIDNGDGTITIQAVNVQSEWYTQILSSVTVSGNVNPDDFIFDPSTGTVGYACFLAGTMIATPDGERAVETLAIGDAVLTASQEIRLVKWIGRQTVVSMFAEPTRAFPIRIAAGALGENMPVRDLYISPDHALLIDGLLVQAGALINGTTIRQVERPEARFTYFHIEVDDHAIILADGVPAETFVDNVSRRRFDNYAEFEALYGPGSPVTEMDLPRVKSMRQLPASIRARLAVHVAA